MQMGEEDGESKQMKEVAAARKRWEALVLSFSSLLVFISPLIGFSSSFSLEGIDEITNA